MTEETREASSLEQEQKPHRLRLPAFVTDETIGLGDAIKRVAWTVGINPCRGCERRAAMLNRWFVLAGRTR
jgi:hypothetical protein